MAKVEIGEALSASIGFIRQGWAVAPAPLTVTVLVAAAAQGYAIVSPGLSLFPLAELVAGVVAAGALYRSALAAEHAGDPRFAAGPGGLQWGVVEWRILGANLLVGLIAALIAFVLILAVSAALAVSGAPFDPAALESLARQGQQGLAQLAAQPAGQAIVLTLLVLALAVFYLSIRLSLLPIRAADLGRFDLRRAWAMTRGATAAILATTITVLAAELAVALLAGFVCDLITGLLGRGEAVLLAAIVGAAAGAAFSVPMTAGLVIFVYRRQRGPDPGAADQFS